MHGSPPFSLLLEVEWGTCALRHRGRRGRESQCKACLGGIAFCGQFLCFAFQSFRHRTAVFLDKVLHKKRSLSACLGARLVPLDTDKHLRLPSAAVKPPSSQLEMSPF